MSETNFRHRLIEARKAHYLSQTQLGEAVGLNKLAIWQIENGKRRPKLDEAILIANTLDVPLYRMCSPDPLRFIARFELDDTQ